MHSDPKTFHLLLKKITDNLIPYLKAQVKAGCQVLQIFDSWIGTLSAADYKEFVFPHTQRLLNALKGTPVIHFGTGNASLIELQKKAGGNIIGVDWRMDIASTWKKLGKVAVQGNLDPVLLFSKPKVIFKEADKILKAVGSKPGFIFNVGHGILPETPVDHVMALVDYIHQWEI
jgi:uroporphyrinogen decarboxylase